MVKIVLAFLISLNLIQVLSAQDISIRDIVYRDGYLFSRPEKNKFIFSYRYHSGRDNVSTFRKIDFDTLLNVTDTTKITFPCEAKMVSMAACGEVTAHLFITSHLYSPDNNEVVAYFSNSKTKKSNFTILSADWYNGQRVHVQSVLNGTAFLFRLRGDHSTDLILIDKNGIIKWKKSFETKKKTIPESFGKGETLFLFLTKKPFDKKQSTELLKINIANGATIYRKILADRDNKKVIDFIMESSDHLIVAGRKMHGKINHKHPENAFLYKVDAQSTLKEISFPPSLNGKLIGWIKAVNEGPDQFLVGETFHSGSSGEYFGKELATGLMTMGMVGITWNSMQFNDLVVYKIGEDSTSRGKTQVEILPLTPRQIQLGIYLPPYVFAQHSIETDQIHFLSKNANKIYLQDGLLVKSYNLTSRSIHNLGHTTNDIRNILFISDSRAITLADKKSANSITIQLRKWDY